MIDNGPMPRRRLPPSVILPSPLRRWFPSAVLVAGVVILLGLDRVQQSAARRAGTADADVLSDDFLRYHDKTFEAAEVIDGNTLNLAVSDRDDPKTRVRLWGVDSPEPGHREIAGMPFGRDAAAFARATLESKSVRIVLSPRQTRDRHGRLLAYVMLEPGGEMFNETLVELGFGYADRRFPHHYADRFEAAERRAKREKRGLWGELPPAQTPEWYQRTVLGLDDANTASSE